MADHHFRVKPHTSPSQPWWPLWSGWCRRLSRLSQSRPRPACPVSSLPLPCVLTLLQPERLEPLEGRNRAVSGFGLLSDSMVRVQPREGARASFAGGALAGGARVRSGVWVFSLLVGSVNSGRAGVLRLVTEHGRQAPVGSGGSARVGTECHVAWGVEMRGF